MPLILVEGEGETVNLSSILIVSATLTVAILLKYILCHL